MSGDNLSLGKYGEDLAEKYLIEKGYEIIERNFRKRYGEIDLVAIEDGFLVFIEVKTRFCHDYPPEEAFTPRKKRNLIRSAEYYKSLHPELPALLRLDLMAIELNTDKSPKRLTLYKDILSN